MRTSRHTESRMNDVVYVPEMCPSMVANVDVGEVMAKARLRRGHVASTVDTKASSK
jgi:hypothetical protein